MKTGDWKKVSVILSDCLEIKHSERQKYLDELNLCSELRAEVEIYLAFEENVEGLMDVSAVEFSKDFFEEVYCRTEMIKLFGNNRSKPIVTVWKK